MRLPSLASELLYFVIHLFNLELYVARSNFQGEFGGM